MSGSNEYFVFNSVPFANSDLDAVVERICDVAVKSVGAHVHFVNAYTLACADRDMALREVLRSAYMNLADGASVVFVSRLFGKPLPERVAGPDVMYEVLRRRNALRHYFLGSTPATVGALIANVRALNPGISIVGHDCPPF